MSLEPHGSQSFELPPDAATETTSAAILDELEQQTIPINPFDEIVTTHVSPQIQIDATEGHQLER